MQLEKILQVYSYLFQIEASSYTINTSEGLKIGYFGWSTITGDAQRLMKDSDISEKINTNFFLADFKDAVKWVSSAPVSFAGAFSQEYVDPFFKLVNKTEKAQIAMLKYYWALIKKHITSLNLTELNHIVLFTLRMFTKPLSYEELSILAGQEDMLDQLVGTSDRLSCLLSPVKRYLPGQDINLAAEFSWLYTDENIDES